MHIQNKFGKLSLALLLLAVFVLTPALIAADATLSADKEDYEPGDKVTYAGSGFTASEVVKLSASGSTNGTQISVETTAGDNGDINGSFNLPLMYEEKYTLTATGQTSGLEVSMSFLDSVKNLDIISPASPVSLYPGETQVYTVKATNSSGQPESGAPISWTATGGTISYTLPPNNKTDVNGEFRCTYTAGSTPGSYAVSAKHGNMEPSQGVTVLTTTTPGDTTAPTTAIELTGTAGTNDWYISDVQVTLTATDNGGSGVKEIHYTINGGATAVVFATTVTFSILTEGNDILEYWAIDNAGNEESVKSATIKIDKTAPVVTITAPADSNCYRTDTLQGLVYSVVDLNPYTVDVNGWSTGEGEHTVTVKATDIAGNIGSASVTYMIDNTPPTTEIVLTGTAGNNGWYLSDVDVTLTATDAVAGVKEIHYTIDGGTETIIPAATVTLSITTEGIHTLEYWAIDKVENKETAGSMEIKIDKTAPTINASRTPAANSFGWNNVDVTVKFETSDTVSGIDALTDPLDEIVSNEGAGQSVSGTVYDMAGNSASATVSDINIDKTAPVVTITTPLDGAAYILNQNISANWSATDALSGIDPDNTSGTIASGSPIPTGTVGANTFTVKATDKAGNITTVNRTYYIRYNFLGFLPPVDNPSVINVGKAGQTFPIKWQLKDANGKFISSLDAVLYNPLRYRQMSAGSSIWCDLLPGDTSGASGLRYDTTSNQYIFTWKTDKSFVNQSYELLLELKDGSVHNALFKFTK